MSLVLLGVTAFCMGPSTKALLSAQAVHCTWQEARVTASDGAAGDDLGGGNSGAGVSIHRSTLALGARRHGAPTDNEGAVYVFSRSGSSWVQQAKLQPDDPGEDEFFGEAVAVWGDTILIGAPGADDLGFGSGAAYVFRRTGSTWHQEAQLLASDAQVTSRFGHSLDLQGDLAVVGAYEHDVQGTPNAGAAYVFVRTGTSWVETARLVANDAEGSDNFGKAVSVDGSSIWVGARWDDDAGLNSGSAYVFERLPGTGWMQVQKVVPTDLGQGDAFGFNVCVQGDLALIGSVSDDSAATNAGSAYVYRRESAGWTQEAKLVAEDAMERDFFGFSVCLDGEMAVVGAYQEDVAGANPGAAYVFLRNGGDWTQAARLVAEDAAPDQDFGRGVSISVDSVAVGSPGTTLDAGAGYVFRTPQAPRPYCVGKVNSSGCVPFVRVTGRPSISASSPFVISAVHALADSTGVLAYGSRQANLDFHGGVLCVKPPLSSLPPEIAKASGAPPCTGILGLDFNAHIQSGSDPALTQGHRLHAQWRQRDPMDPSGFGDSLSNAVTFIICP